MAGLFDYGYGDDSSQYASEFGKMFAQGSLGADYAAPRNPYQVPELAEQNLNFPTSAGDTSTSDTISGIGKAGSDIITAYSQRKKLDAASPRDAQGRIKTAPGGSFVDDPNFNAAGTPSLAKSAPTSPATTYPAPAAGWLHVNPSWMGPAGPQTNTMLGGIAQPPAQPGSYATPNMPSQGIEASPATPPAIQPAQATTATAPVGSSVLQGTAQMGQANALSSLAPVLAGAGAGATTGAGGGDQGLGQIIQLIGGGGRNLTGGGDLAGAAIPGGLLTATQQGTSSKDWLQDTVLNQIATGALGGAGVGIGSGGAVGGGGVMSAIGLLAGGGLG